jgi:hypothetical protein
VFLSAEEIVKHVGPSVEDAFKVYETSTKIFVIEGAGAEAFFAVLAFGTLAVGSLRLPL